MKQAFIFIGLLFFAIQLCGQEPESRKKIRRLEKIRPLVLGLTRGEIIVVLSSVKRKPKHKLNTKALQESLWAEVVNRVDNDKLFLEIFSYIYRAHTVGIVTKELQQKCERMARFVKTLQLKTIIVILKDLGWTIHDKMNTKILLTEISRAHTEQRFNRLAKIIKARTGNNF